MEKKHRRIPYGTMNWAEIVRECHFVDNTAHIRALETVKTPVFLRPKRFEKPAMLIEFKYFPKEKVTGKGEGERRRDRSGRAVSMNWFPVA